MNKAEEYTKMQGWICPRCGKVHSPFSLECNCFPYEFYETNTTGDTNQEENQ